MLTVVSRVSFWLQNIAAYGHWRTTTTPLIRRFGTFVALRGSRKIWLSLVACIVQIHQYLLTFAVTFATHRNHFRGTFSQLLPPELSLSRDPRLTPYLRVCDVAQLLFLVLAIFSERKCSIMIWFWNWRLEPASSGAIYVARPLQSTHKIVIGRFMICDVAWIVPSKTGS